MRESVRIGIGKDIQKAPEIDQNLINLQGLAWGLAMPMSPVIYGVWRASESGSLLVKRLQAFPVEIHVEHCFAGLGCLGMAGPAGGLGLGSANC